jgi:hypothetical protein
MLIYHSDYFYLFKTVYDYVGGGGAFTKTSQVIENEIVTIISSVLYFEKK